MADRLDDDIVTKVRSETNIVDVVSQYVQIKKRGKNYFGFCPFHDERTPSFSVTEEKQIFHCFSCGRGGNVFTFLMEVEGIPFIEAVKKTAEISHIPVTIETAPQRQPSPQETRHELLLQIHEEAMSFYHQVLMNTVTGQEALDYLSGRGFDQATLEQFQIGFSPPDKTALYQYLNLKKFPADALKESGIFSERSGQPELIDRFAGRIIIPLRNPQGKTIAFSGRIIRQSEQVDFHEAKYLNSPETLLFNKRSFLFNFDQARAEIRRSSEVILFEGYMDVIAAWKAGVHNGVASMGTSLTEEQIRMLQKVTESVVIAYDGDTAGLNATRRALELLQPNRLFDLSVFPLEKGMDPDEFIQQKGAAEFVEAVKSRRETVLQFQARYLKDQIGLDSEKNRLQYIDEMLKLLAQNVSVIEREMHLRDLAQEFSLSVETLQKQLQDYLNLNAHQERTEKKHKVAEARNALPEPKQKKQKVSLLEVSEKQLLYRLFHHQEAWQFLNEINPSFQFAHEQYQTIYYLLQEYRHRKGPVVDLNEFLDLLQNQELQNAVTEIEWFNFDGDVTEEEVRDLLHVIDRKASLEQLLLEKRLAMKEAQRKNEAEKVKSLLVEIVTITKDLKATKK